MILRGFQGRFASVARFRTGPGGILFAVFWLAAITGFVLMDLYPESLGV
jgi:cobalt/nickel transport system permease protein